MLGRLSDFPWDLRHDGTHIDVWAAFHNTHATRFWREFVKQISKEQIGRLVEWATETAKVDGLTHGTADFFDYL
jgi:hypothetical protein